MTSNAEITEQTAHTLLNYCLSVATRQKINYKLKFQIPYEVLAQSCGIPEDDMYEFLGTALQLDIKFTWVEHDSEDVEISTEGDSDEHQ